MTDKLEETAQKIADQGREALLARLRPAFQEAAAAHSDVLDLSPDQLDAMVQRAVERADGLQWRRALAAVATEQLGISLGEALGHPAVARAQELAGAPSYEESLAALGPLPVVSATPAAETEAEAPPEEIDAPPGTGAEGTDEDELPDHVALVDVGVEDGLSDDVLADDGVDEQAPGRAPVAEGEEPVIAEEDAGTLVPPPPPSAEEQAAPTPDALPFAEHDADTEYDEATEPDLEGHEQDDLEDDAGLAPSTAEYEALGPYEDDEEYDDVDALRIAVIHLGGIANLTPAERNIELQMSEDGLDIVRGGGEILGRLDWDQVKALEVPTPKGRRRMRRGASTHLIVRTARGDASFEVPEVSPPELEQHLAPIVARHIRPD